MEMSNVMTMNGFRFCLLAPMLLLASLFAGGCPADVQVVSGENPGVSAAVGEPGQVGGACRSEGVECDFGSQCENGLCCGVARGGKGCRSAEDCCGSLACDNGSCCMAAGSPCRSSNECCDELACLPSENGVGNTCQTQAADALAGRNGQPCVGGTTCFSGQVCNFVTGICEACGGQGQTCCDTNIACNDGLLCGLGGVCQAVDGSCGFPGGPCCDPGYCQQGFCNTNTYFCENRSSVASCHVCVSNPGTGWCDDGFNPPQCVPGDQQGPFDRFGSACQPNDPLATWTPPFAVDSCGGTDPCSQFTNNCWACNNSPFNCSFCASTGQCMNDAFRQGGSVFACAEWRPNPGECFGLVGVGVDPCSNLGCAACKGAANQGCGWCGSRGQCVYGGFQGTNPNTGQPVCDAASYGTGQTVICPL